MIFFFVKNNVCATRLFFCEKGPSWGPWGPWIPDPGPQLEPLRPLGLDLGPHLGPLRPPRPRSRAPTRVLEAQGGQIPWSGAQIEKNKHFFPLKSGPAGALIGYRDNQCVFSMVFRGPGFTPAGPLAPAVVETPPPAGPPPRTI